MGTLSASSSSTASNGVASTTFTANKTSGSATIKINLTFNGQFTNLVYVQQIDHDTPFYWMVTSPSQASVGTETYFNVSYTDQWGNVIDHRNPADPYTISLQIGSVAGNAAFEYWNICNQYQPATGWIWKSIGESAARYCCGTK